MLHGILFILKIIGILLLAVVGLILAILLTVLLVPVRYRLQASVLEKKPDVDVRVTWLLHLLSVRVRYHPEGGPFDLAVRILGIRLGRKKKDGKDEKTKFQDQPGAGTEGENEENDIDFGEEELLALLEEGLEDGDNPSGEAEEGAAGADKDESAADAGLAEADQVLTDPDDGRVETDQTPTDSDEEEGEQFFAGDEADSSFSEMEAEESAEKEKSSLIEKIRKLIDKIRNILQSIPEGVEKVKQSMEKLAEKKNSLIAFIQDADNQSLFRLLLRQTGGVFCHIRPRKLKLYLHFGFTDPSLTGKLLGYASVFYAYYYKTVDLVPEFQTDTLILEGNLYAKGRVRAGTLLCKGVRLLFNRGCRKMMKRVLKR